MGPLRSLRHRALVASAGLLALRSSPLLSASRCGISRLPSQQHRQLMGKGGRGRGDWDQGKGSSAWGGGKNAWGSGGYGHGGGRGGGGGGASPWCFAHVCDDADSLGLMALSKKIPDAWVDWSHGGKRKRDRMHVTVLLKMMESEHLPRLQSLCQAAPPITLSIRDLICEHVERITDAEVYCIGALLQSTELRALKDAFISEEPEDKRRLHVPYDGDGHISLAYIYAEHRQAAENFVEEHRGSFCGAGRQLVLTSLTHQDAWRSETYIALAGQGRASSASSTAPAPAAAGSAAPRQMAETLEIDGSVLEGGGQILRMSSSYAALLGRPLRISKIRAGRSKPGLAAQHLESLRLVRDVCSGSLTNDRLQSQEVKLNPGALKPGHFTADPGTAGAITLMIQASICPLMFAGGACTVKLLGGTDVGFSPPLGFCQRMLAPALKQMGGELRLSCERRGFFPRGGGEVRLEIPGLPPSQPLKPIDISVRGDVQKADVKFMVTQSLGNDEAAAVSAVHAGFRDLAPDVSVEVCSVQASDPSHPRIWIEVMVSTSTGASFYGSCDPKDMFGGGKSGKGGRGKGKGGGTGGVMAVVSECISEARPPLEAQLQSGAAVDEHLIDQLIQPATLAAGRSRFLAAPLSLHAQTGIHISGLCWPGVRFHQQQQGSLVLLEVEGVGHVHGFGGHSSGPSSAAQASSAAAVSSSPIPSGQPAKQARTAAEDIVELKKGGLSTMSAQELEDFNGDMTFLSGKTGAVVRVDTAADRLVITGGSQERAAAVGELKEVLAWYRSEGSPI